MSRLTSALLAFAVAGASSFAAPAKFEDGSSFEVGKAEAARLLERAEDLIKDLKEGEYSYAYLQFYWLRAQSNFDRIKRVYPGTPAAIALNDGTVKAGQWDLDYFRNRLLPALEEKRLGASESIKCAIFLCKQYGERWDENRSAAIELVLEVLARQGRWGEAFAVPVPDRDIPRKSAILFQVAARQQTENMVEQLLGEADENQKALYWPILAEAYALLGRERKDLAKLLDEHPEDAVRLAALRGMVTREIQIQRAAALRISVDPKGGLNLPHYSLLNLDVRDNVESVARTFFPAGNPGATEALARYRAALGTRPPGAASAAVHAEYLEYLGAFEKFDEIPAYLQSLSAPATRRALNLKALEVYALAGRTADADRLREQVVRANPELADAAALSQFRGRINSTEIIFEIRKNTYADLPIKDPAVLAQAIMEGELAAHHARRGQDPWDAVVFKFAPGFENLPEPESNEVRDAARTLKQY